MGEMMQRTLRQQKILEIIANQEIETQEELCDELNKENFRVTQATISRDVNEMKLYKVAGTKKKYRYACLATDENNSDKMTNLYKDCVMGIKHVNNLVCVKTKRANASTVGLFVDSLQIEEIIGSVAGDDTLLLIIESNESAPKVLAILQQYLI